MSEKSNKPAKGSDEPNLELPSFSLGRGRKKRVARDLPAAPQQESAQPGVPTADQPAGRPAPAHRPKRPSAPGSAAARREAAARRQALEAQREAARQEAAHEQAEREAAQRETSQDEATASTPPTVDVQRTRAAQSTPSEPDDQVEHTAVLPVAPSPGPAADPGDGTTAAEASPKAPGRSLASRVMSSRDDKSRKTRTKREASPDVNAEDAAETTDGRGAEHNPGDNLEIHLRHDTEAMGARLPRLPGYLAAVVTGILMGLVGVVLAWASAQGCEAVRGVGSCGGFGLFALIVILGLEVLLGAALLKAWNLIDPVSTSFLGVGLVAVIVMLFFLDSIESRWMLLVIPVLTALTYLGSWWVTETLIETEDKELDPTDN